MHGMTRWTFTALLAAAALTMASGDAGATSMSMGGTPEHVAAALTALDAGKHATARTQLRDAIATAAEPPKAREHAREALRALNAGKFKQAKEHAANGAAVEHLTYALGALRAGHATAAKGHLDEAARLPRVATKARLALADIAAHRISAAILAIRSGLAIANADLIRGG